MSDGSPEVPSRRRRRAAALAVLALVALAARLWRIGDTLFWVDEAESTLNAMTILEHGVPTDAYLGQPIFENTLVEEWPGHPEYEFRDSSYSRAGYAIYHGWLPLYAIAAALKASGIEPDAAHEPHRVRHRDDWIARVTLAARVPSILFGTLFVLVLFLAAREIAGSCAAWAAAGAAACSDFTVAIARDARYYSLTLLLGTLACWMTWRIARAGRWRDVIAGALVVGALFHAHVLTCVVACLMLAITTPWTLARPQAARKLAALAAIVGAMVLPWAWWSGFLDQLGAIPKAWPYLELPGDLTRFLADRPAPVALLAAVVLGVVVRDALGARAPSRLQAAYEGRRAATWFLATWVVVGWIAFVALMPAVSNVFSRMALPILGPGLLLAGIAAAGAVRALAGRERPVLATAALLAFLFLATDARPLRSPRDEGLTRNVRDAIAWLRHNEFPAGTRFYATPNHHLTLALYTGIPVQDVAPVRAGFLDDHPGTVVLIEACGAYSPPPDDAIEAALGRPAADDELARLRAGVLREAARSRAGRMAARVVDVAPRAPLPPEVAPLVERVLEFTRAALRRRNPVRWCPAVFRGFDPEDWTDWWRIYFYRFVDPERRKGAGANYAGRLRSATAIMLPSGWTI